MKAIITMMLIVTTLYLFTPSNAEEPKETKHTIEDYLHE